MARILKRIEALERGFRVGKMENHKSCLRSTLLKGAQLEWVDDLIFGVAFNSFSKDDQRLFESAASHRSNGVPLTEAEAAAIKDLELWLDLAGQL